MREQLLYWLVTWVVIGTVVLTFVQRPTFLYIIALTALLSLVLLVKTLSEAWSGEVVAIKRASVKTTDADDQVAWEDVDFAYVKLVNGKLKRMRSMRGWTPGMKLEKRKGERTPRQVAV